MTDPLGESQVIPYLVGLRQKGLQFTVLSFEKSKNYEFNKSKIEILLEKHQINWEPLIYHKKPAFLSTIYDLYKMKSKAKKLYKQHQFDTIHCRSYISSLVGLSMKKKYNLNFIFDMRGFWADERIDGNIWNLKNPFYNTIYKFFKRKEKSFIQASDAIISLTESGKEEMLKWDTSIDSNKITIIPCCTDYELFSIKDKNIKNALKIKLGFQSNDFVFSYLGSLGSWYMLKEMLLFFKEQKRFIPNAKFLFINKGEHLLIKKGIKKLELNQDDFIIENSAREKVNDYLSISDFGIFFIKPLFSKKASSPTKLGEYMAMGIPVICNNNVGDVEKIINETKGGIVIDVMQSINSEDIANQIKQFEYNPERIRENSKRFFTLQNGVENYFDVYQKL